MTQKLIFQAFLLLINRPGVAGDLLKTPELLIYSLSQSSFMKTSSKYFISQTVRARDLKFESIFTTFCVLRVICQVSGVRCTVSHMTIFLPKNIYMSIYTFIKGEKKFSVKISQSGGAIWRRVCYQQG